MICDAQRLFRAAFIISGFVLKRVAVFFLLLVLIAFIEHQFSVCTRQNVFTACCPLLDTVNRHESEMFWNCLNQFQQYSIQTQSLMQLICVHHICYCNRISAVKSSEIPKIANSAKSIRTGFKVICNWKLLKYDNCYQRWLSLCTMSIRSSCLFSFVWPVNSLQDQDNWPNE